MLNNKKLLTFYSAEINLLVEKVTNFDRLQGRFNLTSFNSGLQLLILLKFEKPFLIYLTCVMT